MVMRFPFVTSVDRTEKDKHHNVSEDNPKERNPPPTILTQKQIKSPPPDLTPKKAKSPPTNLTPKKIKSHSTNLTSPKKSDIHNERDMFFLSNLEEVVFNDSPYGCPFSTMNKKRSPPVDYDKYLDFFE